MRPVVRMMGSDGCLPNPVIPPVWAGEGTGAAWGAAWVWFERGWVLFGCCGHWLRHPLPSGDKLGAEEAKCVLCPWHIPAGWGAVEMGCGDDTE